jgi:hypothetical protein
MNGLIDSPISIITSNPIIIVLIVDIVAGFFIMKRQLHPILGVFDIALIFQPLGTDEDIPVPKKNMTELEQKSYVEQHIKGKILTLAYRKEFPVLKEAFRIGKKDSGFTYRINPKRVAFLQRTHRVYEYIHGLSYPINVSYGSPDRLTTSKGMDMFVALKLWGQSLAATGKQNFSAPVLVIVTRHPATTK